MSAPVCPPWCIEGDSCRGEHSSDQSNSIPATGDIPHWSRYGGVFFPAIRTRLVHNTIDHGQPVITLHIGSEAHDTEVYLRLHEAQALLEDLARSVELLRETAGAR